MIRKTIPCETCGKLTFMLGTKRCANCWEVEGRLEDYLKSPGGQEYVHKHLPKLDDWVDGKPDGWDYEAVLRDNKIIVEWSHQLTSDGVTFTEAPPNLCGWGFYWKHGTIYIGQTTETNARKAAALFVSLWLRGVSASFCDKLMETFIVYLERQEATTLCFLAEIDCESKPFFREDSGPFFRLSREGFCCQESFGFDAEHKIIQALDPQPDEEIIVTFSKRKKDQPVGIIRYENEQGELLVADWMVFKRLYAVGQLVVLAGQHYTVLSVKIADGVQHVRLKETK